MIQLSILSMTSSSGISASENWFIITATACMDVMRQKARKTTLINGRREGFRFVFIVESSCL